MHNKSASPEPARVPRVVLVGRPNVGKSTLFNRLTGSRAALVDSTPGLTRDRRYGAVSLGGFFVELVDTGGLDLGAGPDVMASRILEQSERAIREADLVLFLVDGRQGVTAEDREILERLRPLGRSIILVVNKVEGLRQEEGLFEFAEFGVDELVPVSAEHGRGIDDLEERIGAAGRGLGWPKEGATQELPVDSAIRVALIGRPNVGKSSLLNRLTGEPRMIVTDIPGTTRDAIDTRIRRTGKRDIILTDTAGIRRKARVRDKIEKFSVMKAMDAIEACDIGLVVLDAADGVTDQDKHVIGYAARSGRGVITIFNKWDLVQGDPSLVKRRTDELARAKRFIPHAPHLNVSALTGRNTRKLFALVDEVYAQFSAAVTTGKANQALRRAMAARMPPVSRGRHIRLYYTTQVSSTPPTFLVFANYPEQIPGHYERFLEKQFREELSLSHTPIRFVFRGRERGDQD